MNENITFDCKLELIAYGTDSYFSTFESMFLKDRQAADRIGVTLKQAFQYLDENNHYLVNGITRYYVKEVTKKGENILNESGYIL